MNTALTALVNDVYTLTKRPDLIPETLLAVKAATLKCHQSDYFPKDLFETGIVFDSAAFEQSLAYKSVVPQWRAIKYLRKYDPAAVNSDGSTGAAGKEFRVITPELAVDSYGLNELDVLYLAGTVLNIKSSTSFQYALLGCYLNPIVTDDGFASWVATDHPYAITMEAARVVFKTIGYDEQSAAYNQLVAEQFAILKSSNVLALGE